MIGSTLGNLRVLSLLGRGGMGEVYVGQHVTLGRRVAIKVLRAEFSSRDDLVKRFFTEAQAAARVRHPGIVDVYDVGTAGGRAFIVMDLLDGESLRRRVAEGQLPVGLAVEVTRQAALAMGAAHAAGILHRDLKPDNIHLTSDPELPSGLRVKLLDFGLAKVLGDADQGLTGSGALMGTPLYISPEQCLSTGEVDRRTDIYSLGCVLFELLCGRPPFRAAATAAVIGSHLTEAPPDPRSLREGVPVELAALVLKMLEKRAADRPQSMEAVAATLAGVAAAHPAPYITLSRRAEEPERTPALRATAAAASAPAKIAGSSRRGAVVGLLAATAVMGFAVVAAVGARRREIVPAAAAAPAVAASPATAPAAASGAPSALRLGEPAAEAASTVALEARSDPEGAEVLRDGTVVGRTPLVERRPAGRATSYRLRLAGHRDATLTFSGARDDHQTLRLEPLGDGRPPAHKRKGEAGTVGNDILDPFGHR